MFGKINWIKMWGCFLAGALTFIVVGELIIHTAGR